MNNSKTALLLIDTQNDFLSSNGILFGVVKEQLEQLNVVEKINKLLATARKNKMEIIFAPIAFSPNYEELGSSPYGIAKIVKDTGAFKNNDSGSEILSTIEKQDTDIVLPFKKAISAFKTTNLHETLQNKGIDTLVIAGLLTDACMLSTVLEAYDLGYKVVTIEDANAATSHNAREEVVNKIFPLFSTLMKTEDFIDSNQ